MNEVMVYCRFENEEFREKLNEIGTQLSDPVKSFLNNLVRENLHPKTPIEDTRLTDRVEQAISKHSKTDPVAMELMEYWHSLAIYDLVDYALMDLYDRGLLRISPIEKEGPDVINPRVLAPSYYLNE